MSTPNPYASVNSDFDQSNQHDLGAIITNTRTRRIVWAIYVFAGLTLGSLSAWFTTTEGSIPVWLSGALAVSAFLAVPFGTLAIANIKK